MSYWTDMFDEIVEQLEQEARVKDHKQDEKSSSITEIRNLTLKEFARRKMGALIESEILGCNIWLCSDADMVSQMNKDDPGTICYTVDEVLLLLELNPDSESLRKIHEVKRIFPRSNLGSIVANIGESEQQVP